MAVALEGTPVAVQFNAIFEGMTEYTIVCQSSAEFRAAVDAGCEQIVNTFTVAG